MKCGGEICHRREVVAAVLACAISVPGLGRAWRPQQRMYNVAAALGRRARRRIDFNKSSLLDVSRSSMPVKREGQPYGPAPP